MPADFARARQLFDSNGYEISYVDPQSFRQQFTNDTSTGTPEYYTVIDRQIVLGPKPNGGYVLTFSYWRRLSHVDSVTGITAGIMVEDADQPIWEAEYDYLLVVDAAIMGCQLLEFPSADLVSQRDELLTALRADLVREDSDAVLQWGA